MKNLAFIAILICSILGLFIGGLWTSFSPIDGKLTTTIHFTAIDGTSVKISPENNFDTLIFSGYRNCKTVCSRALPLLEEVAIDPKFRETHILFLDLTEGDAKNAILTPNQFPHLTWIQFSKRDLRNTLTLLGLESFDTNHHSARLIIHKRHTDRLIWLENINSDFPKVWERL